VRKGKGPAFEKRWATRKSRLAELDGFKFFGLLRNVPVPAMGPHAPKNPPEQDGEPYTSLTIWDNKSNFMAWRKGDGFKEAHGGGTIGGFVEMFVASFMNSKGPPKPAFYDGLLPVPVSCQNQGDIVNGWRNVQADGQKLLAPELFIASNRFIVRDERAAEFEARWAERELRLNEVPGFRGFLLMRREGEADDKFNYSSLALWQDEKAFKGWLGSDHFRQSHKARENASGDGKKSVGGMGGILLGQPSLACYEAKLTMFKDDTGL